MSLVLWKSILAYQCLKVWNVTLFILGFPRVCASCFLLRLKFVLKLARFVCGPKILSSFRGRVLSKETSLSLILNCLGLLFFSGELMVKTLLVTSIHFRAHTSPARAPVSFRVCRKVAVLFFASCR